MKKILIICTLSFLSLPIFAQLAIKPAIGMNFTDWSKDPITGEFKSKVGYQIGGTIAIGGHVYFEPGIFYVQKSTEYVNDLSGAANADYNLKGVRIPAAIGINILGSQGGFLNVHAFGGASVFLLTGADGSTSISKEDFKDASWGLFAGAGASISMFFVDAQYEWSLTEISKTNIDVGKTRTVFINAGIKIGL